MTGVVCEPLLANTRAFMGVSICGNYVCTREVRRARQKRKSFEVDLPLRSNYGISDFGKRLRLRSKTNFQQNINAITFGRYAMVTCRENEFNGPAGKWREN